MLFHITCNRRWITINIIKFEQKIIYKRKQQIFDFMNHTVKNFQRNYIYDFMNHTVCVIWKVKYVWSSEFAGERDKWTLQTTNLMKLYFNHNTMTTMTNKKKSQNIKRIRFAIVYWSQNKFMFCIRCFSCFIILRYFC